MTPADIGFRTEEDLRTLDRILEDLHARRRDGQSGDLIVIHGPDQAPTQLYLGHTARWAHIRHLPPKKIRPLIPKVTLRLLGQSERLSGAVALETARSRPSSAAG